MCSDQVYICIYLYVFYTYMYFGPCERAANIHMYENVRFFSLISCKFGSTNKILLFLDRKLLSSFTFWKNAALKIKFHAHNVLQKYWYSAIYNNAQIHPNDTVQYLKCIPSVQKAWQTCVHTSVSDKIQSSTQTEGFMYGLVQHILETCARTANIF